MHHDDPNCGPYDCECPECEAMIAAEAAAEIAAEYAWLRHAEAPDAESMRDMDEINRDPGLRY